jgi:flagellar export protein FliJ
MALKLQTLYRILKVRKHEEFLEVQRYSKAQALVEEEDRALRGLVETRKSGFREMEFKEAGHGLALVANDFVRLRERQILAQSKRLETAKAAAEKQFQVLQEKVQQRKMIEKLIERQKAEKKKSAEKKQQKAQDELSRPL